MTKSRQKREFLESEDGKWLQNELKLMVENPDYNTKATYTVTSINELTFVKKHMEYMCKFPYINHRQYVSNLKLKTKISTSNG